MRTLVLVDGEHHPSIVRWAVGIARDRGHDVAGALVVGGMEKFDAGADLGLGVPTLTAGDDRMAALGNAIDAVGAEIVLDLSDEPVLGYRERMELAAVALVRGLPYVGADFRLDPPPQSDPVDAPTVAVIGTGKRTGKTAIAGELARMAAQRDLAPVVVAMGRGGPPEPRLVEPGTVDLAHLLALAARGEHPASDYLEDAVTTGVPTVGARRAGGGLAGAPFASNVAEAATLAAAGGAGLVILEGSGASLPPVPWGAGVLVVSAATPPEYLGGYLGPYRLLRSDLVVVTMAADPSGSGNLSALRSHIRRYLGDARYIVTDFIPVPLADVRDRRAFFTTTAPRAVAARQVHHLETAHGCRIVGWSARLADRAGLAEDLDASQEYDVLLTELKAAAIDVGAVRALARGAEVVFVDNRAVAVEGAGDLARALDQVIDRSLERGNH